VVSCLTGEIGPGSEIIGMILYYMVIGVLANVTFYMIASTMNSFMKPAIILMCCLGQFVPFYLLFGVREKWEVFIWFTVGSVSLSPMNAMMKSYMVELIPKGYSSAVNSLDGCFETITAWIGPLVAGIVFTATDSLRWGMFASSIFAFIGIPVLMKISREKAVAQRHLLEDKHCIL